MTGVRERYERMVQTHQVLPEFDGNELRAARRSLGLSQLQAAEVIGCSINAITDWELGKRTPTRFRQAVFEFIGMAKDRMEQDG